MTYEEKARVLLEKLDEVIAVNWSMEKVYIAAFVRGLKEIERLEDCG